MGKRRSHFTHGGQATGKLNFFLLYTGVFFMFAPFGNLARYLQSNPAAIGPGKRSMVHFKPTLCSGGIDFNGMICMQAVATPHQFSMAIGLRPKKPTISSIGKQ